MKLMVVAMLVISLIIGIVLAFLITLIIQKKVGGDPFEIELFFYCDQSDLFGV